MSPSLSAGKNESEEKRELIFKEDGQGIQSALHLLSTSWCGTFNAASQRAIASCRVCTSAAHAW